MRRIAIAADHAGAPLKQELLALIGLIAPDWTPIDAGLPPGDPTDDYPDAARAVAMLIRAGDAERGILVCGSGIGVTIAANKFPGIGAANVGDAHSAAHGVLHEGLNVLCLPGRTMQPLEAVEIVAAFLSSDPLP